MGNENNSNKNNGNNNGKPQQQQQQAPKQDAPKTEASKTEVKDTAAPAPAAPTPEAPLAELAKKEGEINAGADTGAETPTEDTAPVLDETPVDSTVSTDAPEAPVGSKIAPSQSTEDTTAVKSPEEQAVEMIGYQLDTYAEAMAAGKPMDPAVGAGHQTNLYNLFRQILKLDGPVFSKAWTVLLAKVKENRNNAFDEKRAFRFFEATKLDPAQKQGFQNLIHLAINTADPKGRQAALKLIDLPTATKPLSVPGASEKLISYYAL